MIVTTATTTITIRNHQELKEKNITKGKIARETNTQANNVKRTISMSSWPIPLIPKTCCKISNGV